MLLITFEILGFNKCVQAGLIYLLLPYSVFCFFSFSARQVCLFLKRGANQHATDEDGKDPLSIAVEAANADIVTLYVACPILNGYYRSFTLSTA